MRTKLWPGHTRTEKALFILALLFVLLLGCTVRASEDDPENDLDPPPPADASYEDAADITPWHTYVLSPGETYDVGTAKKNTSVYIEKAGTYYLKGKSKYCRIVIRSSGVDLYLKDGLNIDPNAYAYVGSSTAAITVNDMGGTVRIISEKNAQIYLGGYYYAPAIRKDDHKTKLIFETEDPSAPGTITAYRSRGSLSPGIGSVYRLVIRNGYPGNMEFKSGNIIATGGTDAAGIGCGGDHMVKDLVFSGANVTATGYGHGAGIGGGLSGAVDRLTISGGTIVANGESGAGIGGGKTTNSYSGHCGTITITGGDITATSKYSSGIGNGTEGSVDHIVIKGGNIRAVCESHAGAGIGGTGSNFHGRCAQIDISGGTVYAEGGPTNGVGIGSALAGDTGDTVINISGGYIEAVGGKDGCSIGGGGKGSILDTGHCYVNISGGTILFPDLEGCIRSGYSMTCTITGGSLRCLPTDIGCTPTDGKGNPVTLMNVDLMGCPQGTRVTDASITDPSSGYGMNDIVTLDGEPDKWSVVYPWLPKDTVTTKMTAAGISYYGAAETGSGQGELYPATSITLDANVSSVETGIQNGSAAAVKGEELARDLVHAVRPGYTVSGYIPMRSSRKTVMRPNGLFEPDVAECTDAQGKWLKQGGSTTFYAVWETNGFTVHFDGNLPSGASTAVSGSMDDQSFTYAQPQFLFANAYTLVGYTFSGWNTRPDGSGTALDDMADGSKLCTEPDGTVTLYAQWAPITYTVTFEGDGATAGSMSPQTLTFDKEEALSPNRYSREGYVFNGWEGLGFGSYYADGQKVKNLADTQDAEVTLRAIWMEPAELMFAVSLNGSPAEPCAITLKGGGVTYTPTFTKTDTGLLVCEEAGLPLETFEVFINDRDTGRTLTLPCTEVERFDYYTVSASGSEHVHTVTLNAYSPQTKTLLAETGTGVSGKIPFGSTEGWPRGTEFTVLATDIDIGHTFSAWSSAASEPTYTEGTTANSNPAIFSINGETPLRAQTGAINYTVRFEANVPAGASTSVSGSMADQAFVFDTAQKLSACAFTLEGYTFSGWNTKQDRSGTSYADGASVKNLTNTEGDTVTLYAVWTPITYRVIFNANTGTGTMPAQELTFDEPEKLLENQFSKPDWGFIGWNLDITGTGRAFTDEETVVNLASEQDARVTLYAQWEKWTLIVTDPKDVSVRPGQKATFSVHAIGTGTVRYQWQADRGSGWKNIKGAIRASYSTAPAKLSNNGYKYRCVVTDDHLKVTSGAAKLTVADIPPTGDGNRPLLWLALMLLCGTGIVMMRNKRSA